LREVVIYSNSSSELESSKAKLDLANVIPSSVDYLAVSGLSFFLFFLDFFFESVSIYFSDDGGIGIPLDIGLDTILDERLYICI